MLIAGIIVVENWHTWSVWSKISEESQRQKFWPLGVMQWLHDVIDTSANTTKKFFLETQGTVDTIEKIFSRHKKVSLGPGSENQLLKSYRGLKVSISYTFTLVCENTDIKTRARSVRSWSHCVTSRIFDAVFFLAYLIPGWGRKHWNFDWVSICAISGGQ